MKVEVQCSVCNTTFKKWQSQIRPNQKRFYCSNECKKEDYSIRFNGENNPNFDKRWSDEKKQALSEKVKADFESNPARRISAGSANRGKKFSEDKIARMHANRSRESYVREFDDSVKRKIGEQSKLRWKDPEFIKKQRQARENSGEWVKLSDKNPYFLYRDQSNWIDKMFDFINPSEADLLKELGVFNSRTNNKGVVRDHKFGRKSGFGLGVFPEIMRHPCNCQIITHSENVKKRFSGDSLTLEELFIKIKEFDGAWIEHEIALLKIDEYEQGKRYYVTT